MIQNLINKFNQWRFQKEYKKNFELSRRISLLSELLFQENKTNYVKTPHPLLPTRIKEYIFHIQNVLPRSVKLHLNFGDSLTDLAREQLTDIDGIYSVSGSWSHHVSEVIRALMPEIYKLDLKIEKVSIGCLAGNPMLVYQNFQMAVDEAIDTLNLARVAFNDSKLVVYGLPPVFNIYVAQNTIEFDNRIQDWCKKHNAIFISLKKEFGGIFPSTKWSSDGVHFNPVGARKFNQLLRDA